MTEKEYFIPNIKLVGYGRSQVYQIECLKCKKLFFETTRIERLKQDLFCDYCVNVNFDRYIKKENISKFNFVGNIVGWIVKMAEISRRRSRFNYMKVYKRDHYICQYCGYSPYYCKEFRPLHIDHIVPWSYRGSNKKENMVVACQTCNLILHDKWFRDFTEKKQFILDQLKNKGIKIYIKLKIKFLKEKVNYIENYDRIFARI